MNRWSLIPEMQLSRRRSRRKSQQKPKRLFLSDIVGCHFIPSSSSGCEEVESCGWSHEAWDCCDCRMFLSLYKKKTHLFIFAHYFLIIFPHLATWVHLQKKFSILLYFASLICSSFMGKSSGAKNPSIGMIQQSNFLGQAWLIVFFLLWTPFTQSPLKQRNSCCHAHNLWFSSVYNVHVVLKAIEDVNQATSLLSGFSISVIDWR